MIINHDEITENTSIDGDICIIGGGPAAITIALSFKNTGKKVIVIAGGGWKETAQNQDLSRGIVDPVGSHEPLEENRRRQFGGASTVWGGRCIPFDPIDFQERSWIPQSGWPFSYNDLLPHYKRAIKFCDAGEFNFNATKVFQGKQTQIINNFDNELISSNHLERWSTPVNFARDYENDLRRAVDIRVFLDTHATLINTKDTKNKISSVTVHAGDKNLTITAKRYILACGGIENPRILLASKNNFHPGGIGNDHDVVGRYYMAHLMGTFAGIDPMDRNNFLFEFEKDDKSVYCRRRWGITPKAQKEKKIGNAILFLSTAVNQHGHRDALFSAVFLAKSGLFIIRQKSFSDVFKSLKKLKPALQEHAKNVLKNGLMLAPQIYNLASKRLAKRRMPIILPTINSKQFGLYFQTEQVPNPLSRVTLSETECDRFGTPRVVVQLNFLDIDIKTVVETHKIFIDRFISGNFGKVTFSEDDLYAYIKQKINKFNSSAHHIGTTRISNDPKFGVVDSNCRVHGIENLYIAGSSVFPTGGHANPTLTLVALAVRLADHLKSQDDLTIDHAIYAKVDKRQEVSA